MLSRGDVVLVLFPHSDLRTAKPRPALVVQANDLGTDLPQVIVAMITSKAFRANHPSHARRALGVNATIAVPEPKTGLRLHPQQIGEVSVENQRWAGAWESPYLGI
jgi:mRNA-degrading endonuclease toxin of MazEF toxin-antitoxin module